MTRETKTIQTPEKNHTVVLYTYLTGREFEYVVYQSGFKATSDNGAGNISMNDAKELIHRLIEKLIVSVDNQMTDLDNVILDMHSSDYQFVVDSVSEYLKKK